MKRISILFFAWLSTITVLAQDINVSVFYYPWYDANRHWNEGYMREFLEPPQPPALGHYSNRDAGVIDQHIEWSQDYGIDTWICSWWGPTSWEQTTIKEYIAPMLEGSDVSFCLFYESAGLLNLANGQINFDATRTTRFREHIQFIAEHFFDHPAYHRINGRPVLYIYLTRTFHGDYANALSLVRQDMQDMGYDIFLIGDEVYWGSPNSTRIKTLDAIFAYNMHGPHEYNGYPAQTNFLNRVELQYKAYARIAARYGVAFIPKIMPGFNDRGVRLNADHYIIPSQVHPDSSHTSTLSHFADMARAYIDSTIRTVCVTSFNEWHEDTQVEPTIRSTATRDDMTPGNDYSQNYEYVGYDTDYLDIIRKKFASPSSTVGSSPAQLGEFVLSNSPNPFNLGTEIYYYLPRNTHIRLSIFDLLGRPVRKLVDEHQVSGAYHICWNGYSDLGEPVCSGIYICRLILVRRNYQLMKKMVVIK